MANNDFKQQQPVDVHAAVNTALEQEKKKKKKKKWIIIAIVAIVVILLVAITSGGSEDSDNQSAGTDSSSSVSAQSDEKPEGTIGDYVCTVKEAKLCKDYMGKNAVMITYNFTNNSSDSISFDTALEDKVYQDGIALEIAILDDDTDIFDVDIKPGITKEVKKAYVLRDTKTQLEVEIGEWISFNDEKITAKVDISK